MLNEPNSNLQLTPMIGEQVLTSEQHIRNEYCIKSDLRHPEFADNTI